MMFCLCLSSRLSEYVRSADVPLLSYENLVVRPQKEINKYPRDRKRILLVRSADKWPVSLFSKPWDSLVFMG